MRDGTRRSRAFSGAAQGARADCRTGSIGVTGRRRRVRRPGYSNWLILNEVLESGFSPSRRVARNSRCLRSSGGLSDLEDTIAALGAVNSADTLGRQAATNRRAVIEWR